MLQLRTFLFQKLVNEKISKDVHVNSTRHHSLIAYRGYLKPLGAVIA